MTTRVGDPWDTKPRCEPPEPALPIESIALDVDGTILRSNLTIHRRTVEAVAACRTKGIRVMVATGRRLGTAYAYAREVGADFDLVALDGGLVIEGEGQILRSRPIAADAVRQVVRWAIECDVVVAVQARFYVYGSRRRAPWHVLREAHRRGILRTYAGARHILWEIPPLRSLQSLDPGVEPVYKISPLGPHEGVRELRQRIESRPDLGARLTSPVGGYEVVGRGVSKGDGVAWLLERRGLDPARTLAIGDGWNDVEMFDRVGHPVAMANAAPGVRERARWVTAHVDEQGVAEVLELVAQGLWPPVEGDRPAL
jgi:Cof subfamily protein (haloacid dehalogenase superfamily)